MALQHCSVHGGTPNVLLIVSEDNGPELGAYGNPYARTPVLDSLARDGTLFKNAYVPQAGCSQSRAAFLTGLFPHQSGQIGLATWKYGLYRDNTPNLVERLRGAGYRTGIIGKLHINPEDAFPFDFSEISGSNFQRRDLNAYAEAAEEFFSASATPFFLSVNYPDAHRPFLREVDSLPANPLDPSDVEPLAYMGLDSPTLRRDTANYLNSIARLDSLVGDLLSALERSSKAEETLVVYLGDHGADLLRGKRTTYEGGLRVPLLVRWPGKALAGQSREELVSTIDLVPTILAATGAEAIRGLPGRSLLRLLSGEPAPWREHLFAEYHVHSNHNYYPQRSVRGPRYKLIQNLLPHQENPGYSFTVEKFIGWDEMDQALSQADETVRQAYDRMAVPPEFELYDLRDDPYEFRNLADDPNYQPVLRELRQVLDTWRQETSDPFLEPENVTRLKAEIEATLVDGQYQRPSGWSYREYLMTPAH
ncbi:MAG: sulfatase [Bryobacterales bacterium]|nr:sulfatase [Bryobacterales bacterium]